MPVVFSSTWSESIVLRILALTLGLVGLVERTSSVQAQSVYFSATTWGRGHYGQGPAGFGCHRYDSPFLCGYGYVGGSVVASFGGRSINPGAIGYPSYDAWQHIVYGVPIQMIPTDPVAYVYGYGYAASGALPDPRLGYFTNSTILAPHGLSVSVTPLQTSATRLLKPDFADGLGYAQPLPNSLDSSRRPVTPSTTAARLRSRERQSIGDEHFRKHQWAKAYIEYRAAVDAAPDRAESHHRLGFVGLVGADEVRGQRVVHHLQSSIDGRYVVGGAVFPQQVFKDEDRDVGPHLHLADQILTDDLARKYGCCFSI